jgi:hypothetical protein
VSMSDLFSWQPPTPKPPKPIPATLGGPPHLDARLWLRQIFGSQVAQDGGIVRRKASDVERIVGHAAFEHELRRRGYRAVLNGGHYVIFCNREPIFLIE